MSAHDGHVACVNATDSVTTLCAYVQHGRIVIRTGPAAVGWWPTTPDDLTAAAAALTALADTWTAQHNPTPTADDDHPTLFDTEAAQ